MPENPHPTADSPSAHRPPPVPLNARQPPLRSGGNALTGLMGNRSGPQGSTPIPPSLQAKMAAVSASNYLQIYCLDVILLSF